MIQVDRDVDPTILDERRSSGTSLQQIQEIQLEPLQKEKARLRTKYGIKEDANAMLSIPADLYQ